MATLLPAYGVCKFTTTGERRVAERLQQKLEDDYLLWYDVPVGPSNSHPDFVVLHPKRGILILEVKDWKLETVHGADRQSIQILTPNGLKYVANPLEQARQCAHAVVDWLKRDKQLIAEEGRFAGQLMFPWGYGAVFPNITRRDFENAQLHEVMEPGHVICKDEMTETIDAEFFQQRLWGMFGVKFSAHLTLPQIDRVRWHLFPDIRLDPQKSADLFEKESPQSDGSANVLSAFPEIVRVMDLQQEQLARSLGEGHRVVHGVAGSGKTLILGYRAIHLAAACTRPILILCYNRKLAEKLDHWMHQKDLRGKVVVQTFHKWCLAQLKAYNVSVPHGVEGEEFYAQLVAKMILAVDRKHIPGGQYDALLIDEGHDFRPEWFKLVVQMVNPTSNSLLVMYDDAQSIYQEAVKRKFSFKSVGIEAQGRTTVFKINYRNTREVLRVAAAFAADLLAQYEADDDHVPTLEPISVGREGPKPLFIQLPTLADEMAWVAAHLKKAHDGGLAWREMAVLYREYEPAGKSLMQTVRNAGIPVVWQKDVHFDEAQDSVKVMSMHSSKGLEFPLVILAGLGCVRVGDAESLSEEARVLYVAMTRSTRELVMTCDRETDITRRLAAAAGVKPQDDDEALRAYALKEVESGNVNVALWKTTELLSGDSELAHRERYLGARVVELREFAKEQLRREGRMA
ncbi:MAG: 3'-5' exonuclease [Betaproteobacteria bacterium]